MAKGMTSQGVKRVLTIDTDGIEVRYHEGDSVIELLLSDTVPVPEIVVKGLQSWADDAGLSPLECDHFVDDVIGSGVRKMDERFLLNRMRQPHP